MYIFKMRCGSFHLAAHILHVFRVATRSVGPDLETLTRGYPVLAVLGPVLLLFCLLTGLSRSTHRHVLGDGRVLGR